jgi:hypothetical protein
MRSARLELALESGALVLPDAGDILVLRPRAGDDLSSLPQAQVVVKTGFKPDYEYFAAKGYRMQGDGPFALAVVCLPRAKGEARALMAQAMDGVEAPVIPHAHAVSGRLQGLARASLKMGRSARALAHAILIVHGATTLGVLMLAVICYDFFSDGDLDILQLLV